MVRVLWASPLPPIRSGVSDYAVELLPHLVAEGVEVRLLPPPDWVPEPGWAPPRGVELAPAGSAPEAGEVLLAHVGNNPHHAWLIPHLDRGGAVVVLHDLVLHHLLVEATVAKGDLNGFRDRLERAHPGAGEVLAGARRWGFTSSREPFLFPAHRALLAGCRGCIVHSRWGLRRLQEELPELPALCVSMGVEDPGEVERDVLRLELGVTAEEVLLMHLGFLTPAKGLVEVIEGMAAARRAGVRVRFVLVGEGDEGGTVRRAARAAGVEDAVSWTGWVDIHRLRTLPAAADLGVVVRRPSAGETSAAALRFLACGTPVAVSALPQFLELPEAAAPRLTPGCEAAELARLVIGAWRDRDSLTARRSAARRCFVEGHTLERAARELATALRRLEAAE